MDHQRPDDEGTGRFPPPVCTTDDRRSARLEADGTWFYPPLQDALEEAALHPMREYVRRRQATILQEIATRPIYQLCLEADEWPQSNPKLRWWQQDHSVPEEEEEEEDEEN